MPFREEKRRFPRVPHPVCAWISFRKDTAAYGTLTVDLCPDGARFGALHQVETGERLLLSLQLPSANVECKGKVCWTDVSANGLHYFGVRFVDLSEAERDLLDEFTSESLAATAAP